MFANTYLQNWRIACGLALSDSALHENQPVFYQYQWVPPVEGRLKLNVDVATHESRNKTGYGFVMRDHRGHFVAAHYGATPGLKQLAVAKGIDLREALSWIKT